MFFIDFNNLNEFLIENPYLIFIFLLIFFIDSFPPFIFIIPLLLINLVIFYYLLHFHPELIPLYFLAASLAIFFGDIIYLKFYKGSFFTKFTRKFFNLDIKNRSMDLNKKRNFFLIRFNVIYKLIFFERLNKNLNIREIILIFIGIILFLLSVFLASLSIYLFDKLFNAKYLDILFLILFVLIFNYIFSFDLNEKENNKNIN